MDRLAAAGTSGIAAELVRCRGAASSSQCNIDVILCPRTPPAKSRLNILGLRQAGHGDYVLNEAAFGSMRSRGLSGLAMARLAAAGPIHFAGLAALKALLDRLDGAPAPQLACCAALERMSAGAIQALRDRLMARLSPRGPGPVTPTAFADAIQGRVPV